MAKATTSSKRAFAAGRGNLWLFVPDELVLVDDKSDPLYDPRVKAPPDENLVRNILHQGVINPVTIVKRGDQAVVVAGRGRVKAAREANRRSRKAGGPEIKVPCTLRRADGKGLMGLMISENEIRRDDGPTEKAKKAQGLLDAGYTEEELATVFGVTPQTIRNWLSVLEVSPKVRKAIERGEVAASIAPRVRNLPYAKQEETIAKVQAGAKKARRGNGNGRATVAAVAKTVSAGNGKASRMRNRVEIENRLKTSNLAEDYAKALRWVLRMEG
jgi:ParB-like chromosome segregation protein Spo0J